MGYYPMDINQAMHTLSLTSPDEQYYLGTDATSHMTRSQDTLINYYPLKRHLNNAIVVGNGDMIPVHGLSLPPINLST